MGKTSAEAKNRYNKKAYDRIELVVPKGQKEIIKAHAEAQGESVNSFIHKAILEQLKNPDLSDAKRNELIEKLYDGVEIK